MRDSFAEGMYGALPKLTPEQEKLYGVMSINNAFANLEHEKRLEKASTKLTLLGTGAGSVIAGSLVGLDRLLAHGENLERLVSIVRSDLYYYYLLLQPTDIAGYAMAAISVASLGLWAVDHFVSKKHQDLEYLAEAVLSIPHTSPESESEFYRARSGKKAEKWPAVRQEHFRTMARWAVADHASAAVYDRNVVVGDSVPTRVLHPDYYQAPALDELLGMCIPADAKKAMADKKIPLARLLRKGQYVSFAVPKQPNQGPSFFSGYVVKGLPEKTQDFISPETVLYKLKSGEHVIGTVGPELRERKESQVRKALIEIIQREALAIFYPISHPKEAPRIVYVTEGTHPWVRGGVATVIDDMMQGLQEDKEFAQLGVIFETVSLWANQGPFNTKVNYPIPPFMHVQQPLLLYGYSKNPAFERSGPLPYPDGATEEGRKKYLKQGLLNLEQAIVTNDIPLFYRTAALLEHFSLSELAHSETTVEAIHEVYHKEQKEGKPPFINYFSDWLSMREPLHRIIKADSVPAEGYYAVANGLSGVYSALARKRAGTGFVRIRPEEKPNGMVLTEHGIYQEDFYVIFANSGLTPFMHEKWKKVMDFYAHVTYDAAVVPTTTATSNVFKQIRDGALLEKIELIPGSVPVGDLPDLEARLHQNPKGFVVGLLGNVQTVKRVEVFIEAAYLIVKEHPELPMEFHVMGKDDPREQTYVNQIHNLVKQRKIPNFHFSGYTDYKVAFAPLDCGVLTSASEVQPRSVMEIMAEAKPMIAPDVGGIRDIIYGDDIPGHPFNDFLGMAGLVVPLGSAREIVERTADAILSLYYRKQVLLGAQLDSVPGRYRANTETLLGQPLSPERVGWQRMKQDCAREVVIPKYRNIFREVFVI